MYIIIVAAIMHNKPQTSMSNTSCGKLTNYLKSVTRLFSYDHQVVMSVLRHQVVSPHHNAVAIYYLLHLEQSIITIYL